MMNKELINFFDQQQSWWPLIPFIICNCEQAFICKGFIMELFVLFLISISKIRLSSKCQGLAVKSWNKILNLINKNH